jgi:hypothetical protein
LNAPFRSILAAGIDAFVGIVRFRKGPEDVPVSRGLLAVVLAGAALLGLVQSSVPAPQAGGNPFVLIALDIGIWLASVRLVLLLAGAPERFLQTASAIYGCQLVLAPLLVASYWMLLTWYQHPGMGGLVSMFSAAVLVWLVLIIARVLRSATGWPLFATVLLTLAIEAAKVLTGILLYPPPPAAAGA